LSHAIVSRSRRNARASSIFGANARFSHSAERRAKQLRSRVFSGGLSGIRGGSLPPVSGGGLLSDEPEEVAGSEVSALPPFSSTLEPSPCVGGLA
jgi:hypothetical protein